MPADAVLAKAGAAEVRKSLHYAKDWLIELFLIVFARFRSSCYTPGNYYLGRCF